MKRILTLAALLAAGSALLVDVSRAHGGSYRGPGDTVPPGGGGGGGGGGTSGGTPGGSGGSTGMPTGPSGQPGGSGGQTGGRTAANGGATGITSEPDLATWEFWWGFNKDRYLNLKARVHAGSGITLHDDDFWSGADRTRNRRDVYKPSEETIRTKIVPALLQALESERSNDIVTGALIALAKIGDVRSEEGRPELEPILARFLADPNQEIAETAAIALGILADDGSIAKLRDLALDTPDGRRLVGTTEVKYRTRAFAAYGLGLLGNRTKSNALRQEIARILADLLQRRDASTRDVKVAALVAFGVVPVDVDPDEAAAPGADPGASRQAQLRFLRRFYQDHDQHHLVRAHAPTSMARLLAGAPEELKEGVARLLLEALDPSSTEKDAVRQSCVLSLGTIGDADADAVDRDIRAALRRMASEGDLQSKNFTNIALAQVGGRPGSGADNEKGAKEARDFLLAQLREGRSHMQPWAGLGIGVLEHGLAKHDVTGGTASATAKDALRAAFDDAVSPEKVGAFAIGLGIAGDARSSETLNRRFASLREANARGYVAIALGLVDARASIPTIQEVVRESKYRPDLLKSTAIGLGLLGDKNLVPELCAMLAEAKGLSSQAAIASALGFIGDSRSVDPLVAMLQRKEGITDSARGFAAVALGIVADKELLPWNSKLSADINYRASTPTLTGENGTGVLDLL